MTKQYSKFSNMHAVTMFGMRIYDCDQNMVSRAMCALGVFYPQESVFKFYECLNHNYDYTSE